MRVQFSGRTPAFQAGCVGSIPITRSTCANSSAGQSNCLLSSRSGVRVPFSALLWWVQLSWLKRQFVALEIVGSNPITHPTYSCSRSSPELRDFTTIYWGVAQRLGQRTLTPSSLVRIQPSQILLFKIQYDPLAQLAEHLTFNQGVRGSNPRWVTLYSDKARNDFFLPYRYIYIVDYPPIRE